MGVRWEAFVEFVKAGLSEFRHTEFGQVRYADRDLAIALSIATLALLLLKTATLAVRRRKHSPPALGPFHCLRASPGILGEGNPYRAEADPGGGVGAPAGGDLRSLLDQH